MSILVKEISYQETKPWLLEKHYAERMPSISFAFGLVVFGVIIGVVTYGKPASPRVCEGICGKKLSKSVYELNRLCINSTAPKNSASILVGRSLKLLPEKLVLISYADTGQGHVGYVYQATNWKYYGLSNKARDRVFLDGTKLHNRHMYANPDYRSTTKMVDRSRKHRYVTFTGTKRDKKNLKKALKYPILPYPKGDSERYICKDIIQYANQEVRV